MKPKIETEKGWTEVVIDDDCEFEKFYRAADILQNKFNIAFTNKLNDFDSLYWDFIYKEKSLTLFYNIYEGVTVFPKAYKDSTQSDNQFAKEIGNRLFEALIDLNWTAFANGKTIGTKGSENGIVTCDIENSGGARVTVEKDCGNIPFAITIGIYGLMFHTHYESDAEKANNYVTEIKFRINKFFDLFDVEEVRRTDFWQTKYESQLNELAGVFDETNS
ncbi:hypothetical protein [Rufibacter ruber]|uniref:hypothetical protein n=1 Tax=Rufibacter ruber TaxID=1783499 RepID=UPI0008377FBD|nr:hypothetical protein [Rufibacter ruber]